MKYWHRNVLRLERPGFGQIGVWVLLTLACVLACLPFDYQIYPRSSVPSTLLSFLPDPLLRSPWLMNSMRGALLVSSLLWASKKLIPISCWVTVITFAAVWSLRMENTIHGAHIFNVTNWLLLIHAAWFQFHRSAIQQALRDQRFWSSPIYPAWVTFLSVFFIGWFHTTAGLSKLSASGLSWADGTSLQLWVYMFGWEPSPLGQLIASHSLLARGLQAATLVIELGAVLCIVNRTLRTSIGCLLLGFYLGVLTTFVDFGFHANALLVALFLLPADRFSQSVSRNLFG